MPEPDRRVNITPEQWAVLSALLDEALELPPAARAAWVESLRGPNASLKEELARLLERQARIETSDFLGTIPKLGDGAATVPPAAVPVGTAVGPYVIEQEIGRGGMGIVYRAHRADGLIKRPVALKLLHPGLATAELLGRFARERDILASLTHPNIARLYDAGSTDTGQPYIALEYVEGLSLIDYCDGRRLALRERLRLLVQILRAVQFAHTNLVIHRDLKPSNILVTATGEVRLLDFGIAKPLREHGALATEVTQFGGRALTPDYAAPEQLLGHAVSTASDVYSLGVVMYELLCGCRPYRPKRASVAALEEAVLLTEPVRPSHAAIEAHAAAARASTVRSLRRALAGDLDAIALKTLRKSPSERYATADAFAQDLERHLAGEPVLAQPESSWYRAGKFIRRNVFVVAATMAVVVALAAGLGVALLQTKRANEEARVARSVQAFLQDVFQANSKSNVSPAKAQQTTARELLDIGTSKIDAALADSPRAKLEVLETLGAMHHDLGLDDKSVELLQRRVDLTRQYYGNDDVRLASALRDLSLSLADTSRVGERPTVITEGLAILDRAGDRSSNLRANLLGDFAQYYLEFDLPKALGYAHASSQIMEGRPASEDVQEALVMEGTILNYMGRFAEAGALLERAVTASKQAFGDPNPHLPHVEVYLAEARYGAGDFAGAEQAYRSAFKVGADSLGPSHVDTLGCEARLGNFLARTGRPREGVDVLRDAHERSVATLPADDPVNLPIVRELYGWELARLGPFEKGYALLTDATLAWQRRDPKSSWVLSALERSAYVLVDSGSYDTARDLLDQASRVRAALKDETTYPNGNATARIHLALALGDWRAADEAAAHFRQPVTAPGGTSLPALDLALSRAEIALARGDYAGAQTLAATTRSAIVGGTKRQYLREYEGRALLLEGSALLGAGARDSALPLLQVADALYLDLLDPPTSLQVARAHFTLARCLRALGRPGEAAPLLAQAAAIFRQHPVLGAQWRKSLEAASHEPLGARAT